MIIVFNFVFFIAYPFSISPPSPPLSPTAAEARPPPVRAGAYPLRGADAAAAERRLRHAAMQAQLRSPQPPLDGVGPPQPPPDGVLRAAAGRSLSGVVTFRIGMCGKDMRPICNGSICCNET